MGKKLLFVLLVMSILCNGILLIVVSKRNSEVVSARGFTATQQKYPLLSKRILQEFPQDILINFLDLRTALREQVASYGNDVGFYFEYLPTGTTIGVNEKVEFHAASLFKLPVVMAYYHAKDRMHSKEDPLLQIRPEDIDKEFGDLWKRGVGTKIKASEAVKLAIIESDNTAAKMIVPLITQEDFNAVYEALDVDLRSDQEGAYLSAKNYASILKALYFSSVLSKDSSEEILDLLTKTKFPDKLVAGVPHEILVAHKIGDFVDKDGNEGFRDCGIVYASRRPYLLCMFSVGDEQVARQRMQAVSKTVYDYISSVRQ